MIVDFPNPPPPLDNQSFGFTLNFELPGDATPVRLKALFAARVESNGQTFFVPLLPCETTFCQYLHHHPAPEQYLPEREPSAR